MPIPKVAIVIVNWNGKADTLECLASLRTDIYPHKQIIVVDNGSADESVAAIRQQFPEATVLEAGANLGFCGGNNAGIRYALNGDIDYICLLNNDTVVEAETLTTLVATAEANPQYGLFTPIIHYYDGREEAWFAGSALDLRRGKAEHINSPVPTRDEAPITIPWSTGCAMLIRSDLLRTLHGFDERYFLYWEDVDLSLRIRKQGYLLSLVPKARIYHKVGRSASRISGTTSYYRVRNSLLFVSEHGPFPNLRAVRHIIAPRLRAGLIGWLQRPSADSNLLIPTLCGLRDHFLGRYGQRRVTIKE
jgi:GT2 family glycosyltransferase